MLNIYNIFINLHQIKIAEDVRLRIGVLRMHEKCQVVATSLFYLQNSIRNVDPIRYIWPIFRKMAFTYTHFTEQAILHTLRFNIESFNLLTDILQNDHENVFANNESIRRKVWRNLPYTFWKQIWGRHCRNNFFIQIYVFCLCYISFVITPFKEVTMWKYQINFLTTKVGQYHFTFFFFFFGKCSLEFS